MAATIVGLNIVGWGMLALALRGHHHINRTAFFGFGTGVLAYTLGMRHAFDADHIAAIDNTTRKLIHDGERPLSVGYFFSLGHSTIVFVLAVLLNFGIRALNGAVQNNTLRPAPLDGHHRHLHLGDVPLSDRAAEPRCPVLHPQGEPGDAAGRVRRRRTRTSARQPRAHEPSPRAAMPSAWTRPRRCTRSGCSSGWASTPPARWPSWCSPARRSWAACRSTPCSRCRSSSPPGCASSTPSTDAS